MTIAGPKTSPDSEDHLLECEFVIEPMFQLIADMAEAAGWSRQAVALALAGLAATRIEELDAGEATIAAIRTRRLEH